MTLETIIDELNGISSTRSLLPVDVFIWVLEYYHCKWNN